MLRWMLLLPVAALAADVQSLPPTSPDKNSSYVFYLHGRILETSGPKPVSKDYGVYDYPAILEALSGPNTTIIASQRAPNTEPFEHAGRVVGQIESLLQAGVPEKNIAVVGFSKGGFIALFVSSFLRRADVSFVILGACDPDFPMSHLRLTGRVLSIWEASDSIAGSCQTFQSRSPPPKAFKEIRIETGKNHGAFYMPRAEWVAPTLAWIADGRR